LLCLGSSWQKILDLLSGLWCLGLGYSHPGFNVAVQEQLDKLVNVGTGIVPVEIYEAMEILGTIVPSALKRVTFLSSGSEAVEFALKTACASTGRSRIIGLEQGYYGATSRAFALSAVGRQTDYIPRNDDPQIISPRCTHCPIQQTFPDCYFECLHVSARRIEEELDVDDIAAVIFEPVQAGAGVIVPPPGYLQALADLAQRWGALLISEEVTTGMGRTGRWFGFEHGGITPDILVLGKILGNGFPVSSVITTEAVEKACEDRVRHVQSHQNDPVSGKIVTTVIQIMQAEGLVERSASMGDYLLEGLQQLCDRHSIVSEARGCGLIAALQLCPGAEESGAQLYEALTDEGVIVDYQPHSRTFRFLPAFVITQADLDMVLTALDTQLPCP
jgi:4-aminobutyrate aminotransferase-like enzyme